MVFCCGLFVEVLVWSVDWTMSVVFIIVTQWGLSGGPFLVPGSSAGRNLPLGEGYLSRI